jgi:hypothetical protein
MWTAHNSTHPLHPIIPLPTPPPSILSAKHTPAYVLTVSDVRELGSASIPDSHLAWLRRRCSSSSSLGAALRLIKHSQEVQPLSGLVAVAAAAATGSYYNS